jgi:DNA-directed RNA polymerase subunit RPC12/RpoP
MMNQLRKFMYGRYGFDQFTRALVLASLIVSLLSTFTRINLFVILAYLPFVYALFRIFSKNIAKRTQENMKYCRATALLRNKFNEIKLSLLGTKTHRYYKCAHCKQTIRVPRGKGKISITCPKCKTEFVRRT